MLHIYLYVILVSLITVAIYFVYYIVNVYYLTRHRGKEDIDPATAERDVTILMPVYNEKIRLFEEALDKVSKQKVKFVVVGDGSNEPYRTITERKGGVFVLLKHRGGKRKALAEAIKYVDSKFVLFVDSDTVIPVNTTDMMLSHFENNIGGVGANVSIRKNSSGASYSAEFMERTREIILKAMSAHGGSVMVIDGKCSMYRTELIKPLLLSEEFNNQKIAGKATMMGDDQQMTAYIIKKGYKAEKCYEIVVETDPPDNFKQFTKQSLRWARSSYYYFFKNLFDGTARRAGAFYTFETISTFLLPIVAMTLGLFRFYFEAQSLLLHAGDSISTLISFLMSDMSFSGTHMYVNILTMLGLPGPIVFTSAITKNLRRERLTTLAYGGVALVIILFTSLYGFVTCWKQSQWLTR